MDLGLVANSARRVGAVELRGGAERIALSTRLLVPLLQGQALGDASMAQLTRDLRAQLASGGDRNVTLILPAQAASEAQAARIDLGGRQFAIPAALRDALLAQLMPTGRVPPAAVAAAAVVDEAAARAWAVGAQAQAAAGAAPPLPLAAAISASTAGATREVARALAPQQTTALRDQALPATGFERPLLNNGVAALLPIAAINGVAARLQQQLERSGMFFEAHLAQWTAGARSTDEIRAELLHMSASGQALAEGNAQRVAAQLSVLQHQGLVLQGPAWPGQPMQLEVRREPPPAEMAADAAPVFTATLRLDLPQLGPIEVKLRLAGEAIAASVNCRDPAAIAAEVPALVEQLRARGLTPVAIQASAEAAA